LTAFRGWDEPDSDLPSVASSFDAGIHHFVVCIYADNETVPAHARPKPIRVAAQIALARETKVIISPSFDRNPSVLQRR
jgi:hypothetical protein